jgi:two-component system, NtrC family, response regulator AtoC
MSVAHDFASANPTVVRETLRTPFSSQSEELMLTMSDSMKQLHVQIEKVAPFDVPVLLLGESGVGKEYVARHLHWSSPRARHSFLKVNCAALPSELLESELFGYEKGAFTGATRSKPGQFELCNQGTVLLDEIAEMPPALQAKLLHILQDQCFSRLGGRRVVNVSIRVIAATNVDIEEALAEKRFRPDLYYRLNTFVLRVPPLRERCEDIPLFLSYFLTRMSAQFGVSARPISPRILEACLKYSWPGNVRELKNFVCRFLLLEEEDEMMELFHDRKSEEQIASKLDQQLPPRPFGLKSITRTVHEGVEKRLIAETLAKSRWNRTEAARQLQICPKSLRKKIHQYNICSLLEEEPPAKFKDAP